jgi:DNA-binding MarR family transcriptional regulator
MLVASKYLGESRIVDDDSEYAAISHELTMFVRRAIRMQDKRRDPNGLGLDRAAYHLLGRLATEGPGRLSTIAADMDVDLSVVSRQVAALEAAGLVERESDPTDRRASRVTATDAGLELFHRNRAQLRGKLRGLLADWTEAERIEFARLMRRFNEALTAHDEGK